MEETTHVAPAAAPVAVAAVKKDYTPLYIPGAIIVAGLIIGISLIVAFGGGSQSGTATGPEQIAVNVEDINIEGNPYIGDEDAPVTLISWEDFQCPYCKAVEVGHPQIPTPPSMPTLVKEYVATGKLKIVFKDYAFLSEDSDTAALYGRAVWELYPSKYYEWREAMYTAQDEEHAGFGNEATILQLSKTIAGIDSAALKAKVAAKKADYTALIAADRAEGSKYGISGTPGFVTGETVIPGAVGIEEFKKAIDAQL